ncbi:hypothetical protein BJG93_32795 (plasmid) [Paraburkholderia sprentiae WSM5005]|uniref:Uncharacterized protein n=1 Tax=Paraburkholderia sprentiae WSM5005 TaxID=754502 RepID=A0ACA8AXB9_9BURK|nr:hypothetical protein [Paraburkholderia sprentiae]APA90375.1 hypothetical protein BJG93_32795 [Paraburkholderia sprentiae WSM5005]
MDLRQIQALHAQYSGQPVVIDITSHNAAMPALPAPEGGKFLRSHGGTLTAALRTARRPALIGVAVAALAGLAGMSAARVWHATHESFQPAPAAVAPASARASTAAQSTDDSTMPVNAAPAKPLTAGDFDMQKASGPSGLANVDARSLAMPPAAARIDPRTAAESTRPEQGAAASPIHAQRAAAAPQAPALTATPAPGQNASTPTASPAPGAATAAPTAPAAPAPAEQSHASAKPALRPLHHITRHEPAANEQPAAPATTTPTPSKAPAAKSGDVQLF